MARTQAQKDRRNDLRAQQDFGRERDFKGSLLSLFREAIRTQMPFRTILERRSAIYSRPGYSKMSQRSHTRLSGYCDAMFDLINAEHLEWRLTLPDGTWVNAMTFPYSTVNVRSYDMHGAHFWKGTDAFYNAPESTRSMPAAS